MPSVHLDLSKNEGEGAVGFGWRSRPQSHAFRSVRMMVWIVFCLWVARWNEIERSGAGEKERERGDSALATLWRV